MAEASGNNYQPFSVRSQEVETVFWKIFFIFLAGNTNGAHNDFVKKLQCLGHSDVKSFEACDYIEFFCPVASQAETDISMAMNRVPAGKPVILVVMHLTFNRDHVVAESRRLVTDTNVCLTVGDKLYPATISPGMRSRRFSEIHRIMPQEVAAVLWRIFYVILAGNTNGAHNVFVEKLQHCGHAEANSPDGCDYVLVFCPISARVRTDIRQAMSKAPVGKPVILVVMRHTFSPDHVVAESRRLVTDPNVHLTVDCLYSQDRFLNCNRNDISWHDVEKFLGLSQVSSPEWDINDLWTREIVTTCTLVFFGAVLVRMMSM